MLIIAYKLFWLAWDSCQLAITQRKGHERWTRGHERWAWEGTSGTAVSPEVGGRVRPAGSRWLMDSFFQLLSDSLLGVLMCPQIPHLVTSRAPLELQALGDSD